MHLLLPSWQKSTIRYHSELYRMHLKSQVLPRDDTFFRIFLEISLKNPLSLVCVCVRACVRSCVFVYLPHALVCPLISIIWYPIIDGVVILNENITTEMSLSSLLNQTIWGTFDASWTKQLKKKTVSYSFKLNVQSNRPCTDIGKPPITPPKWQTQILSNVYCWTVVCW